ncbi:MAG: tetratricopeptide repeat protein [Endomicrobiales bacterium]|nr:tetratricopeptide repeat protein [Endomicrobiales bacterium]
MKKLAIFMIAVSCAASAFGLAVQDNKDGVKAMNEGRYEDAITHFLSARRSDQSNDTIKQNLIEAYIASAGRWSKKGEFNKAYDSIKKAHDISPDSPRVNRNFAVLLANEAGRRDREENGRDAVYLLEQSVSYDGSIPQTRVMLGQAYYDKDNYRKAKEQWEKALELDPSLKGVKKKLAKLKKEMKGSESLLDAGKYHFKVRFEGVELWNASQGVLDILEDAYRNAGWKLNAFPQKPLTVIIYTQQQFSEVLGKPDWFAGVYDGKIRLRRGDVEGNKQVLRRIVYHEYMHAFVYDIAGNNVPLWLNEGIAQCYETMPDKAVLTSGEKRLLKSRLETGMPDLETVNTMFVSTTSAADVGFAYLYSKAFVFYLIEKGWDYNIKNLLVELANGATIDAAFDKVYFGNVEKTRADWLRGVKYDY